MHARQISAGCRLIVFLICSVLILPASSLSAATEEVIHNFTGSPDGRLPTGGLVADAAGNLYGTTQASGGHGRGIVFELSPPATVGGAWTETILFSFENGGGVGESYPGGTLIFDKLGNLYGTTIGSGFNDGSVFELSPPAIAGGAWTQTRLWAFDPSGAQGNAPSGKMAMDVAGNLYGTTSSGGAHNAGVVFELVAPKTEGGAWRERILYAFGAVANDGSNPGNDLLLRGGILYGTTTGGGANGVGTVFRLVGKPGLWTETILHTFSGNDGAFPYGGLIADNRGNFYGTTVSGGTASICAGNSPPGCGTIYELSPPAVTGGTWQQTTLYSFHTGTDGGYPYVGLWRDKLGNLYGTGTGGRGAGSLFELSPPTVPGGEWTLVTLHAFRTKADPNDGAFPRCVPIFVNGAFYGTTVQGGTTGDGTIFSVVP